ncbi:hypothetical protein AB0A77_11315 [Streptomyces varsoviensis]|uniref:hypothetical protein n=1 Tax=Streptomyces varsoviensis TaxID=67373 RepID=UPI0033CDB2F0
MTEISAFEDYGRDRSRDQSGDYSRSRNSTDHSTAHDRDDGDDRARQWLTLTGRKRVLVIVHTVTYGKRLRDVVSLLEADFRVQVLFTAPPHEFGDGVAQFLQGLGSAVLPWDEAVRMDFDLALTAGPRRVEEVRAPVITLPHGANYLKRVVDARAGAPGSYVFGLGRPDLVPGGGALPAAVVVPHRDDLRALARSCPEALPAAVVVGDPAHDRIVASLPLRETYRRALGLRNGQKLIAVTSTWGPRSLFARIEMLLPLLSGEITRNGEHRMALLVHPNVWAAHGAWQVRAWLAWCEHLGVGLVPPEADWRAVLIIGDHGSVTLYGTLTGAPILLAAAPEQEINPDSPAAALAVTAPALSAAHPLSEQLSYAAAEYRREDYAPIAARITSEPGGFNRNMRRLLYRTLGLGQPAHEPVTRPLPAPDPLPVPVPPGPLDSGDVEVPTYRAPLG